MPPSIMAMHVQQRMSVDASCRRQSGASKNPHSSASDQHSAPNDWCCVKLVKCRAKSETERNGACLWKCLHPLRGHYFLCAVCTPFQPRSGRLV